MALTKSDIPDLLLPGLKAEFALAYRNEQQADVVSQLATVIQTTLPVQRYPLLDNAPAMREFVDERRATGLTSQAISIEDKVFESTIAVERKALEDDQLDLIRLRIRDLANRVVHHRHELVVNTLTGGTSILGYDGANLLSADHPEAGGNASNVSADALGSAGLKAACSAMISRRDNEGVPLGITPNVLLVGPQNMWTAIELVDSKGTAQCSGQVNVFNGMLKVVLSPFITDESWYLLDTTRPMRGIILQQRSDVPVEFAALESAKGSDSAFFNDRFYYGVRARYNAGPGMWQTVFGGGIEL
jgi:phage major head subunit gpT-like protein